MPDECPVARDPARDGDWDGRSLAEDCRPKVALLVNVVAPYRVPIYEALARSFRLTLLYGGGEDNRSMWSAPEVRGAAVKRSRGFVFKRAQRARRGGVWENRYLHITPGYLPDLWRTRPDAVITNEMGFRTLVALLYATVCRKPAWIWWGGTLHTERFIGRCRRLVRSVIVGWAKRWISYGDSSTEYLESLGVPRTDIVQIQNAVDEQTFVAGGPRALDLRPRPVVLCVGRMVKLKGIQHLLDACAIVQGGGVRFTLVMIGDGPEREALERRVRELGLEDVHALGEVAPDQMPGIYRSADLLVFPALQDRWGLVVNEALWSGVPVLASRYAGCATELLPPENVFDPEDSVAFASKLKQAVTEGLAAPDTSRMSPIRVVAAGLVGDINRILESRGLVAARV